MLRESLAHFDRHLRSEGSSPAPPPVRYFATGGGGWRSAESWPPKAASERWLHLRAHSEDAEEDAAPPTPGTHRLSWNAPERDEPDLTWEQDPNDPMPALGGALFGLKGGVRDLRRRGPRADRLHYQSAPLGEDLWIAGPPSLSLSISCDREDADIFVTLIDGEPDGSLRNLCDGMLRCRWRGVPTDCEEPSFIEPGQVVDVDIELGSIAHVFRAGHRIGLEISSACAPRFDRNSGTREPPALCTPEDAVPSRQTVHHGRTHSPRLRLLVLDQGR
jgi:putative CocE/NonD family hydrolase